MRGLDNFKTVTKKMEATEIMWFLRRILQISRTAKKSNETVLREADSTKSLVKRILIHHATFFWPCDEESEIRMVE